MSDDLDEYEPGDPRRGGRPPAGTALERKERSTFVRRLATLTEHNRMLCVQLEQRGIKPCVRPQTVVIADDTTAAIAHLQTELRIALGKVEALRSDKARLCDRVAALSRSAICEKSPEKLPGGTP